MRWVALIAALIIATPTLARDDGRYAAADPAVRAWYEHAELTEAAQKRFSFKSCCAHSDVVRTQFRVSRDDGADQWWWLDKGRWQPVPPDIIHWGEAAPNGQPTLFLLNGDGEPTCFYPGEGGN